MVCVVVVVQVLLVLVSPVSVQLHCGRHSTFDPLRLLLPHTSLFGQSAVDVCVLGVQLPPWHPVGVQVVSIVVSIVSVS